MPGWAGGAPGGGLGGTAAIERHGADVRQRQGGVRGGRLRLPVQQFGTDPLELPIDGQLTDVRGDVSPGEPNISPLRSPSTRTRTYAA